jgi:hypothetical protein
VDSFVVRSLEIWKRRRKIGSNWYSSKVKDTALLVKKYPIAIIGFVGDWPMYSDIEFDDAKKHFFAQNLDSISRNGFLSATINSSST